MNHLGGHGGKTWVDVGTLKYLKEKFDVRSMIDVGCGPMGMQKVALECGIDWTGIDGDPVLKSLDEDSFILWDFTGGKFPLYMSVTNQWDLAWSVEFLEHVEEKYQANYMAIFQACKYVVCTAAPEGWGGHHHVNEQNEEYWKEKFKEYGFRFDQSITNKIRHITTMKQKRGKSFMARTGMFYINENQK